MVRQSNPRQVARASHVITPAAKRTSKTAEKQNRKAEDSFMKAALATTDDDNNDERKFCKDQLNQNPIWARYLAGLYKKNYFDRLIETHYGTAPTAAPSEARAAAEDPSMGRCLGKMSRVVQLKLADKKELIYDALQICVKKKSEPYIRRLFDRVFVVSSVTEFPDGDDAKYYEPVKKLLFTRRAAFGKPLANVDVLAMNFELDATSSYYSVDGSTVRSNLTMPSVAIALPYRNSDGNEYEWTLTTPWDAMNATVTAKEEPTFVVQLSLLFGYGYLNFKSLTSMPAVQTDGARDEAAAAAAAAVESDASDGSALEQSRGAGEDVD